MNSGKSRSRTYSARLSRIRARVTGGMANMAPSYRLPRSDPSLQENQVQPAVELVADLAQVAALFKAEPLVEADGSGVGGVDAGNHDVLAERGGAREQRLQQKRARA